ncbi:hypothetical protein B0H14DRAFT_2608320 [Mycena olivaceomarginata]|nr:hypothetical protein B0H14DRAFT_2608320 [Mycena olivaceomarginata]
MSMNEVNIAYGQTTKALLVYEYLLTLEWEVQYIWKPPHRKATAWYLLVRYFALGANVALFTLSFVNFPAEAYVGVSVLLNYCLTLVNVHDVLGWCKGWRLSVAVTLILRILAMYSYDRRVICIIMVTTLVTIALYIWSVVRSGPPLVYKTNLPGCHTAVASSRDGGLMGGNSPARNSLIPGPMLPSSTFCLANLANILMYCIANLNSGLSAFTIAYTFFLPGVAQDFGYGDLPTDAQPSQGRVHDK